MKYQLIISYDGTAYCGWQVQPNSLSIQSIIQNALETLLKEPISVTGSGRTDAGVHALAQSAHFATEKPFDLCKLHTSLNGILPLDIRILSIQPVENDFHARYSALSKVYRYHIHCNKTMHPFRRLYSLHLPYPIDLQLLKEAAFNFIGQHDFTSFANEGDRGSCSRNPVRTIQRLDLVEEDHGFYLEFEADGFLYKMVRNITGTLLAAGKGKISPCDVPKIFDAKDRKQAAAAAPPHGLFLVRVNYFQEAASANEEKRTMFLSPASLS